MGGIRLGLGLSSASWVIGKAPASAQQLGMSLGRCATAAAGREGTPSVLRCSADFAAGRSKI